jgi:hypothetical protein
MDISSFPGQKPVHRPESVVEPDVEPVFVPVPGRKLVFPVGLKPFQLRPEAKEPVARLWQLVS